MNPAVPLSEMIDVDRVLADIAGGLKTNGFLYLEASRVTRLLSKIADTAIGDDPLFLDSWNCLETDQYMADGGKYRKRRHAVMVMSQADQQPRLLLVVLDDNWLSLIQSKQTRRQYRHYGTELLPGGCPPPTTSASPP